MFGFGSFKTLAAAVVLVVSAGVAQAAPVQTFCPNSPSSNVRDFSVTIDDVNGAAGCILSGTGNTDNAPSEGLILAAVAPGTLLDKTDSVGASGVVISATGVGALSGLWSILVPNGFDLVDAFLALKSGAGGGDPEWALFSLPDGILAGSWTIEDPTLTAAQNAACQAPGRPPRYCNDFNGEQSLSHMSLYGRLVPSQVPVPAAGLMLLGALGGLAALRRRRKAA